MATNHHHHLSVSRCREGRILHYFLVKLEWTVCSIPQLLAFNRGLRVVSCSGLAGELETCLVRLVYYLGAPNNVMAFSLLCSLQLASAMIDSQGRQTVFDKFSFKFENCLLRLS